MRQKPSATAAVRGELHHLPRFYRTINDLLALPSGSLGERVSRPLSGHRDGTTKARHSSSTSSSLTLVTRTSLPPALPWQGPLAGISADQAGPSAFSSRYRARYAISAHSAGGVVAE